MKDLERNARNRKWNTLEFYRKQTKGISFYEKGEGGRDKDLGGIAGPLSLYTIYTYIYNIYIYICIIYQNPKHDAGNKAQLFSSFKKF